MVTITTKNAKNKIETKCIHSLDKLKKEAIDLSQKIKAKKVEVIGVSYDFEEEKMLIQKYNIVEIVDG